VCPPYRGLCFVYDFNTLLYAGLARQKMCVRSATPLHSAEKHYFDLIFGQLQSPIHFTLLITPEKKVYFCTLLLLLQM